MKTLMIILALTASTFSAHAKVEDLGLLIKQNRADQKQLEKALRGQLQKNDKLAMRTKPNSRTIKPDNQNAFYVPSTKLVFEKDQRQVDPSQKAAKARLAEELKVSGE